jgi:hypothetical protein
MADLCQVGSPDKIESKSWDEAWCLVYILVVASGGKRWASVSASSACG